MSRPFPRVAADLPAQHVRSLPASDFGSPHNLVIDGRPEQVSAARAFVRQVLGSSHPGAERAALLTSELVTNSVLHSDSRRPGNTITVTLTGITDGIRVEVLDAGGASVPSLARIDDEVTDHGLGLRLVSDLSARWGYHRDGAGLVTWFEVGAEPGHAGSYGLMPMCGEAQPTGSALDRVRLMAGRTLRRSRHLPAPGGGPPAPPALTGERHHSQLNTDDPAALRS